MQILTATQIREWDAYTIRHEPITSIDLMERAAAACWQWLLHNGFAAHPLAIICGKGNNGGDGLAIARMAAEAGVPVDVFVIDAGQSATADFSTNWERLVNCPVQTNIIALADELPALARNTIIIDALFGTGMSRPAEGLFAAVIAWMNQSSLPIISIDMPSGLLADEATEGMAVKATHTLSFERTKMAFMMPENKVYCGNVHMLPIALHSEFEKKASSPNHLLTLKEVKKVYQPRQSFAHKGTLGHALLMAGSWGKMGAAVLSAEACLRSGAGLLTCVIPACGYVVMQTTVPEAMVKTDKDEKMLTELPDIPARANAIGIGPGIGTAAITNQMLMTLLHQIKLPVVLDADALNILAANGLPSSFSTPTILTPHIGEFDRLFGSSVHHFDRIHKAREKAQLLDCIIILKGHHTAICLPDGNIWFNSTGNPGMATAGSGDVLTGLLTGLLAQGYSAEEAAMLGVFLHGLAGDFAADKISPEAMLASDISASFGKAFQRIAQS